MVKISHWSPKTKFELQNQYGRVICLSIIQPKNTFLCSDGLFSPF
jgi:hypothetical protein